MQRLFNYYWGDSPADEEESVCETEEEASEVESNDGEDALDLAPGIDTEESQDKALIGEQGNDGARSQSATLNGADNTEVPGKKLENSQLTEQTVSKNEEETEGDITTMTDADIAIDCQSSTAAEVGTQNNSKAESNLGSSTAAMNLDYANRANQTKIGTSSLVVETAQNPEIAKYEFTANQADAQMDFAHDQTSEITEEIREYSFEQITDDLIIPQTTIAASSIGAEVEESNHSCEEIEREGDAYPKAQEFLAVVDDEEQTIPPENAAGIIAFDDEDSRTVFTTRTTATTVSRRVQTQTLTASVVEEAKKHEHQSLFDILDRNFEELGDAGVGYKDVKLCFVAFVVVFAPSGKTVDDGVHTLKSDTLHDDETADDEHNNDIREKAEDQPTKPQSQTLESETTSEVSRPYVPLTVVFALWRQVLQLSPGNNDTMILSYVRSTLVLLDLLELSSIESVDAPIPTINNNRRHLSKPSCIECLRLHHDINQKYGEYLAYGDHCDFLKSTIPLQEQKWNNAVVDEALAMGSNEYIIRMLPLHTMRAYHMQDTFELLKDNSFVRRRIRLMGASDAALAQIRDIDELLRLIDQQSLSNYPIDEPVDEKAGVLSAFDQMKKYYFYITNELTKHNNTAEEEVEANTDSVSATALDKTTLSKIRDVGKALHLIGVSLGGYGFLDQEMEYYNEALRLKELSARGQLDYVSISDTLHCMGFSMDNAGRSEEALEFYDRALEIRYEYLGDDDLRVAETLHNKGALLCDEETSEEAMECLEEALRIRELHYGEEHESCADTMQWMGNLMRQYGDPSDALEYFKFALRIKQIRLGPDHIDVANTLFNTAVLLDDVEKYDLSLIAYKEAYRIRKLVLGDKSQDVADTLFCLGNVATVMERNEEAMEYFNESVKVLEELIRDDDVYSGKNDDSLLFISQPCSLKPGLHVQYQKLNQCLEQVLPLTKLFVGSNHGDVCKLLNRMGDVYKRLHDWDNAIGSYQGALRVKRSEEETNNDDAEVATLLQKKGEVHLYKSEFIRAKSTFDASLQIHEKLSGRDSSAYASSLYCLGVAYHCLKDYSHSKLLFQECYRVFVNSPGKSSCFEALSLFWLGRNYHSLNEHNKALEKYLLALHHFKVNKVAADYMVIVMLLRTIGETYENEAIKLPDLALKCYTEEIHLIESKLDIEDIEVASLLALAHYKAGLLCRAKEDISVSIEHLEQGLNCVKQMDDDKQDSIKAMIADTLGVLYTSKADHDTAKQYFSDSYSLYEKTLGREHVTTSDCAFRLAECLERVGSNLALDFYAESLRVHRLHISDDDERVGTLLFSIGRVYFSKDAFPNAATSFDEALKTRRKLFGDCHSVAETYHHLANSYFQLHQLEKALIFYKESVRIIKKLGSERTSLYKVSLDMASCCETLKNYTLAIEAYNDCLQMTKELEDNTNIAFVLERMGQIHMSLHNYDDATKLFLDALELLQSEDSAESHKDRCSAISLMFQIGQVFALAKEYEKALDFYEEHIKLVESIEPVNEELVGNSLLEMGVILADMDDNSDYELAIEKLTESLDIRRKVLGQDDEQVADVLHKLAAVYEKAQDYDKAVKCLSEALRTFKMKQQIAKASNTYHTLARMKASVSEKSGSDADREAAIECYESAIDTRRGDPALDDIELASMLYEYATLLCLDNNYVKAMPLLEESLRIQKSKNGLRDERVANILLRTAECHVHRGKFDSSLVSLEQVLFIQDSLGSCDIDVVLLNHLLGITYLERGDYEKSISTSLAALKMMKMEFSQDSLECADIYTNLGKAYGSLNEYANAIEYLVEALRIQKIELGNDSVEYAENVLYLAGLHISTDKQTQAINCLDECIRVFESLEDEKCSLADALEMKADCHFTLRDYPAASSTFIECINIVESLGTENYTERRASLLHRLGKSYRIDFDNAFSSYRESIKLYNEALGSDSLPVANVMYDVGLLTSDNGDSEKALQCFKECIRIYKHNDQQQDTKVADALVQIGSIQADNSEYEESMETVKKAIRLYKEKLGNDATEIGKALLLCGRLNDASGDYDKMMSNFSEALRIFKAKSSSSERDMNISIALSNLGVAHSRKQEFSEAVEMCKESLRIRKLHTTSNDRDVADSLFNLGNLYYEWGKHQEALPYVKGSLQLYRDLSGDEDIAVAHCQLKLGAIYFNASDIEGAINSYSDALYVCEEVDDEVEPLFISIYKGLGDCYSSKGDLRLALESYASCLKIQKLEYGDDCIEMAESCESIGRIYQESGKHDEAIQFYKKALQIYEHQHGKTSSQRLSVYIKISDALMDKGSYEDAIGHINKCIELFPTERHQPESEDIAIVYHQLGVALMKTGKNNDAIAALNKVTDMMTHIHGKGSSQVAKAMLDLGTALEEYDADEALSVYDEAISILQGLSECDKSKLADAYSRIADILSSQSKYEAALVMLKRTLKLNSEVYGSDSFDVAKTLVHLGSVYCNLENIERASSCFSEGIKIFRSSQSKSEVNDVVMSQAMMDLAKTYACTKMYDKAIELCTESLRILKQYPAKESDGTVADTCLVIAEILNDWEKIEQSTKFYEEALRFYEEKIGPESSQVATCYYGIANNQKKLDDPQAALKSFGKSLRIHRLDGDKTIHVANDLFQIGQIYDTYGEISKAFQCFQECLKIRQAFLSEDDLDLLAARRCVDSMRRKMER